MTTAQVVETSVTVNNNNPIQDYVHSDDQTQPTLVQYVGENRCPNFQGLFTTKAIKSHVKLHLKSDAQRVICAVLNKQVPRRSSENRKQYPMAFNRKSATLKLSTKINKCHGGLSKNKIFYKCFSFGERAFAFFSISDFLTIWCAQIFID